MKLSDSPAGALLALFLLHGLLHAGTGQEPSIFEDPHDRSARVPSDGAEVRPTVFEGRVLMPEGTPAQGAVVVSSAGGSAVTDAQGCFSLEVELPGGVQKIHISAAHSGGSTGLVSSAEVAVLQSGGTSSVRTLRLGLGGGCDPSWLPTFGGRPGVDDYVSALAVFDDGSGSGPALYVGGSFTNAGSVAANRIAKWDGSSWAPLGSGMTGSVPALTVFDDGSGSGPALYAGGGFTVAGGVVVNHIAKWDGTSWTPLGSGMNSYIVALAVHDDGSGGGPELYAGGDFTTAG